MTFINNIIYQTKNSNYFSLSCDIRIQEYLEEMELRIINITMRRPIQFLVGKFNHLNQSIYHLI